MEVLLQFFEAVSTVDVIVGLVVAILGALIGLGIIGRRLAPVVKELNEALELYAKAKQPDSDGGRTITEAERQKLREEALDIFVKAWQQYKGTFVDWFTQLFRRKK